MRENETKGNMMVKMKEQMRGNKGKVRGKVRGKEEAC